MVNYEEAKIYQIRSYKTEKVYIGSTCQKLSMRMAGHRRSFKGYLKGKYNYVTSFEIIKFGDAYIELIEIFPCKDREELCKREGYYIRKLNCVNKHIMGRTIQESKKAYKAKNRDKVNALQKKYRERHSLIIRKKANKKYICDCGVTGTKSNKSRHIKSIIHRIYLFNLHNELNHL